MQKRTMMMLIISIIGVIGASTIVYNAIAPDNENLESSLSDTSITETTTSEITSTDTTSTDTTISETIVSTVIDAATNKTAPNETTVNITTSKAAGTTGITVTAPPSAVQTPAAATTVPPVVKGNAPDFAVYDSSGNTVKLSDYLGKAVVLNFWASWCPPCKAEMPDFQSMYTKYSSQNVVFLMINMTDGSRETKATATAYLNSNGFTFKPIFDTKQSASTAYGVSSIPQTVFITKGGDISSKNIGQISASALENGIKTIMQ